MRKNFDFAYDWTRASNPEKHKLVHKDGLTAEQIKWLYRREYWEKSGCDHLPNVTDVIHYNTVLESGAGRAKKYLDESGGSGVEYVKRRAYAARADERKFFKLIDLLVECLKLK